MKQVVMFVFGAALMFTSCVHYTVAAEECAFTEELNATLDPESATRVRVIAKAGSLEIEGRPGISEVQVRGRACASSEQLLQAIRLIAERRGGEVFIEADLPRAGGMWGNSSLDIVVSVPAAMELDVNDGSGGARIRGVASLRLEDGSGEIEIEDIGGRVTIDDSSGELEVTGVNGNVEIEDGSGEIRVSQVKGTVRIRDGSGSLRAEDVTGDVVIVRDGSGSITVRGVTGDFTVERDGSGSIDYDGVDGQVSVPRDS